jgi:hypothetical protein
MAHDDEDVTGPRVGRWVPEYTSKPSAAADRDADGADRLIATPSTDTGFGLHRGEETGRRRAVLIVALIFTMVLLSAGGIAYALHNQSPVQPDLAEPFTPSPSAQTSFSDTQLNPALTISQSPPAAVSGPPSSVAPSGTVSVSSPPPAATPSTGKPTTKPTTAKTTPPAALSSLTPGKAVSLEPTSRPGTRLRHWNGEAFLDVIDTSSATQKADSRWIVHDGLGDATCISFESSNFRGEYLHKQGSRLRRDAPDGSAQFDTDATFCAEKKGSASKVQLRNTAFEYLVRQDTGVFFTAQGVPGETFLVHPPL